MNILYKYSFQTYGKEETPKIVVVSEAKTQVPMSGFQKTPIFQGSIDMSCYLSSVTKPLIVAFELNFEVTWFGHKLA